jgi:ribosomal protein S18 acetylase RimI-like enzyme
MDNEDIRQMRSEDIDHVVDIHMKELPDDFLPSLGLVFLKKVFYPAIIRSKHAHSLVSVSKEEISGFSIISLNSKKILFDVFLSKPFRFLMELLKFIGKSIKNISVVINIYLSVNKIPKYDNVGEVYFIAVKNSFQGEGIGGKLINGSEDILRQFGFDGICIKTKREKKTWVNYLQSRGWKTDKVFSVNKIEYIYLINFF